MCTCKKVKAHTSQRPKCPELILVSLAWSMPRSIAKPSTPPIPLLAPLNGMLVHRRVTPSSVSPVPTNLYTWVKAAETKRSKIPCLRKQHDGWVRLEPGLPDPLSHMRPYMAYMYLALNYLCQLCFPWDLWQLFRSSLVSPLLYFSYDKCMAI